ncbi:MAG: AraC family transcriptional regulator [Bacteroidales bacterium]|jgi:AraC family transcriptional regulator|nr:AraC family transcriptional regulator [Bacteroidales bacterium]
MQQKQSTIEEYRKRINIIVEYVNNHLDENIDLEKLAGLSHFSTFHFHRIAKAFLGEPIGMFIMRTRVETAARFIRYSNVPIREIAYMVGYDAPSSLSKAFRQFYGVSPNYYRKNKNFVIMKSVNVRPELVLDQKEVNLKDKQVLYIRLTGDYLKNAYCEAWEKLWKFTADKKLIIRNPEFLCIYHDDPKVTKSENLRTDVCLTFEGNVDPQGEIGLKNIEGGRYVVFLYKGPYEHLSAVYDTIYGKCLPENGYSIASKPGFEKYLNNPSDTLPEDLETEIYVPVEK